MLSLEERETLIQKALVARQWAYAPYSEYAVGAALLAESGNTYTGANIENAAYPVSICAERVAVFAAVHQGERNFRAIAVATENGGAPCGSCRQVLAEFGLETQVLIVDARGEVTKEMRLGELLPDAFTPADLQSRDA
ncbi:MAG: cytidine deaminase [Anaerolineales bacterium]|jgi:cytidine deaminase